MAPTVPYVQNPAWTDGSGGGTPITGAKLNTLEQGLTDAHQMPAVRVFNSATQSFPSGSETAVTFNSERFDQAGGAASTMHDVTTNNSRLTCRYAGIYLISANFTFTFNSTNNRILRLRLNGTTAIARVLVPANGNAIDGGVNITTIYQLAVNDYVELLALQDSGSTLTSLVLANTSPEFMMARVA